VIYGALAALPIFLIWIYLSWVVALIGAEVVAVLQQKRLLEDTLIDRVESNLSKHDVDSENANRRNLNGPALQSGSALRDGTALADDESVRADDPVKVSSGAGSS
jgi:hypothetical protein